MKLFVEFVEPANIAKISIALEELLYEVREIRNVITKGLQRLKGLYDAVNFVIDIEL